MAGTARLRPAMVLLLRIACTLCLAGTVAFIFRNSSDIAAVSSGKSAPITGRFNDLLVRLGYSLVLTEHTVRKLAHLAEYTLLGFWLMLTLRVYSRRILSYMAWPLFSGLLVAVLDEFYQTTIPGRDGQVKDVVLDFGGVLTGIACGLFALLLLQAAYDTFIRRRKQ